MANIRTTLTPERRQALFDLLGTLDLSGSSGASGSGTIGDTSAAATPELQAFLNAIPYANDGDVITPDHHNSLRDAINTIARGLDASQFAKVVTLNFLPNLLPSFTDDNPSSPHPWRVIEGVAQGPKTGTDAQGWMPLDLPDGTSVDSMAVRASTTSKPDAFYAAVRRYPLDGSGSTDIVGGDFDDQFKEGGTKTVTFTQTPGQNLTPTIEGQLRRVDTSQYRYGFGIALSSAAASQVQVMLVQVTCVRGSTN